VPWPFGVGGGLFCCSSVAALSRIVGRVAHEHLSGRDHDGRSLSRFSQARLEYEGEFYPTSARKGFDITGRINSASFTGYLHMRIWLCPVQVDGQADENALLRR